MFCTRCGSALGADDKFCARCGEAVHAHPEQGAVPVAAPVATPAPIAAATAFRDPTRLFTWLIWLLYVSIAIDVIAIYSGVLQYRLVSDFEMGVYVDKASIDAAAESNDNRQKMVGVVQICAALAKIVVFAMWIYRANFNARALGAQDLEFSPGWAVGYFFVPILCLWKPYQAIKEIWRASKAPESWVWVKAGPALPWWWCFAILSFILGNLSGRLALQAKEINEVLTFTAMQIVSEGTGIVAVTLALLVVRQIHEMQMAHFLQRP